MNHAQDRRRSLHGARLVAAVPAGPATDRGPLGSLAVRGSRPQTAAMMLPFFPRKIPCRSVRAAAACLPIALLIAACADHRPALEVALTDLAEFAPFYDGRRIMATGVVHRIEDPEHYWIEDDALHRVAVEPDGAVSGLLGERVRVTGRFRFDPEEGRSLRAEAVLPLSP